MKSKEELLTGKAFRELRKEWYKRLDDSGFNDIERSGRRRQDLFNEYGGISVSYTHLTLPTKRIV